VKLCCKHCCSAACRHLLRRGGGLHRHDWSRDGWRAWWCCRCSPDLAGTLQLLGLVALVAGGRLEHAAAPGARAMSRLLVCLSVVSLEVVGALVVVLVVCLPAARDLATELLPLGRRLGHYDA